MRPIPAKRSQVDQKALYQQPQLRAVIHPPGIPPPLQPKCPPVLPSTITPSIVLATQASNPDPRGQLIQGLPPHLHTVLTSPQTLLSVLLPPTVLLYPGLVERYLAGSTFHCCMSASMSSQFGVSGLSGVWASACTKFMFVGCLRSKLCCT